ncbi:hypothetical protein K7N18_37200, partial [Burkholderia arboris]|uniref:hypothetical protein n=1 Tax=Burkholderia arboris TaxID=488730 RepID=UPI001CA443DB
GAGCGRFCFSAGAGGRGRAPPPPPPRPPPRPPPPPPPRRWSVVCCASGQPIGHWSTTMPSL